MATTYTIVEVLSDKEFLIDIAQDGVTILSRHHVATKDGESQLQQIAEDILQAVPA